MKYVIFLIIMFISIFSSGQKIYKYPETAKNEIEDTIWGKIVIDPYRWLEDIHSERTKDWLKAQEKVKNKCYGITYHPLSKYLSFYSHIDYKPIFKEGKYYFLYRYDSDNQTPSLYYQKDENKEPKFLLNPNSLDKSATTSIDGISISEDNKILALILARNSGDWKTIRFLDIDTKNLLDDSISFVKYSPIYWSGKGIFYMKYDVGDTHESFSGLIKGKSIFYHKIGTKQCSDIQIYRPENEYSDIDFEVTPKHQYLIIYHSRQKNNKQASIVSSMLLPIDTVQELKDFIISSEKGIYFDVLGEVSTGLLVRTNFKAINGAIYKYDPNKTNNGEVFIPQYKERLEYSKMIGDKILKIYNDDKQSFATICDSTGKDLTAWEIPEGYTFSRFSGTTNDSTALYSFNSFFSPASIYKINLNTFERSPLSKTYIWFNNKDLITEKIYYISKDSTRIPMYITHLKNIKLNGNNPTILYGYGGFGISMELFFSVPNIIFLKNGGVLATPCLRGGGDFPGWHEKGMRLNKQNTFDDFICAAEYLIANKYTNPGKIAAMGGSHGGLVVGACMVQRPELFKVVVSESGVFDMLRKETYNIGYISAEEYGTITDSLDFEVLYHYSPINNVKKGVNYPATLLVAYDNDDRVLPYNSFKFISELQSKGSDKNPYILYYQEKAGHSGSDVFAKKIETDAFIYSFIYKYLGLGDIKFSSW